MIRKEYFDVSRIVSAYFIPEHTATKFYWQDSKPITTFFGLINTGRFTKAGWFNACDWNEELYTEDEIRRYGYKVYSTDERINERICNKAHVKVYLTHDNTIEQSFETDKEAEAWIELLKEKSGKTFEVAIYKN
jgi:hypothetical protein